MAPAGRTRRLGRLTALLAFAAAATVASAQDERPTGREPPRADSPDVSPPKFDAFGFPIRSKRKEKVSGTAIARPPDKNASKTAESRSDYISKLLADESRDRRAGMRAAAERACLTESLAALPPGTSPDVRSALEESKRMLGAGNFTEAHAQAVKASALDWKLLAPRLLAARALDALGRGDEAVKGPLDVAVSNAPADPVALHVRGLHLWTLGRLDDARRDLARAREVRPSDGWIALSLGAFEIDRGEVKAARDLLLAASDALPADVTALREFARTLWLTEDWSGAAAVFERVIRMVEGPPLPPGQVAVAGRDAALTEHLALAVLLADRLDRRAPAKAHAQKFLQEGGLDLSLDEWLKKLAGP